MNENYSKIYMFAMVEDNLGEKENTFHTYQIKVRTIENTKSNHFIVETSIPKEKKKMGAYKKGDILFIKGNYYFHTVFPDDMIKIKSFREESKALLFLSNIHMSQDVYINGTETNEGIHIKLPNDVPITGTLLAEDTIQTKEFTHHGAIENNEFCKK